MSLLGFGRKTGFHALEVLLDAIVAKLISDLSPPSFRHKKKQA